MACPRSYIFLTWIDFSIAGDSIGINEVLEPLGELISSVERGWDLSCRHEVEDGWYQATGGFL